MAEAMLTTAELARWLDGRLVGNDVAFNSVSQDTRSLPAGALYVAIVGERLDGHDYLAAAAQAGAVAALVSREVADSPIPQVIVDDSKLALGRFGSLWRQRFAIPVAAVTGSSGKTTVKDLLTCICAAAAGGADKVLATQGNLNNDLGVPLTLLRLRATHRYAVIEMGMNHHGEIRYLTGLAKPDVALINNAMPVHLEGVGSLRGVAEAKGEIYEGLAASGTAILNAEDEFADYWRSLNPGRRQIAFGLNKGDVTATATLGALSSDIVLNTPEGKLATRLAIPGVHNVKNAAAATAAALALGIALDAIAQGLAAYAGTKGRLQVKPARFGGLLVDDTYNANPGSMKAALDVLAQLPGRRIFVMGGMGELGPDSAQLHAEVGAYAVGRADALYAYGLDTPQAVAAFGAEGRQFDDVAALTAALAPTLDAQSAVLVKGSRSMRMERVVDALKLETDDQKGAH